MNKGHFKRVLFKDRNGNEYDFKDILREVWDMVILLFLIPLTLAYFIPRNLWMNRKTCPYWDHPYCKKNSLVRQMDKPCGLGDAQDHCLHYTE